MKRTPGRSTDGGTARPPPLVAFVGEPDAIAAAPDAPVIVDCSCAVVRGVCRVKRSRCVSKAGLSQSSHREPRQGRNGAIRAGCQSKGYLGGAGAWAIVNCCSMEQRTALMTPTVGQNRGRCAIHRRRP